MNTPLKVPLFHPERNEHVEAILHERVDGDFARRADKLWKAHLDELNSSGHILAEKEHDHWQWESKVAESAHLLSCPTFAVEYKDEPQGLMLLQTDGRFGRLEGQNGKPLIYVTYLACAPWNNKNLVKVPRFKGVGSILMRAAIETSFDYDFKGRIGLHSLPQAEEFYENFGLEYKGIDRGLKYFELSEMVASQLI